MLFSLNWTILIELILIFKVVFASAFYCVHHDSQSLRTCQKGHTISAAVADTPLIENKQQLSFDLSCTADPNECASVQATLQKAVDVLSSVFQFESSLRVNATYGPFCPSSDNNCSTENRMSAIGQAYPAISYIMVDQTDNMTRLYPQALLKQFTSLPVKPNWAYYDINAEFNSQVNWYFFNSSNPIRSDQIDLLRNVVHEFIHGLGFVSSWSDSFYTKLAPFVDGIDRFITPMLLTSVKESSASSYDTPQPFWGFVEFPFDKLIYANSSNALSPFTAVTNQLNQFYGSNVTFKSSLDWANAWYASDAYKVASNAYSRTVSADNVLAVVNNMPTLLLETSLNPFSQGSSLCHVDQQTYANSTEFLMVYMADRGVSLTLNKANHGLFGPKLIKVMAGLGYQINTSFFNATTIRPGLNYWIPPQGLVNTSQNPSPSLVSYTNGPAHAPIASTSSIPISHTSSSNHLIISSWLLLLLLLLLLLFNVLMC